MPVVLSVYGSCCDDTAQLIEGKPPGVVENCLDDIPAVRLHRSRSKSGRTVDFRSGRWPGRYQVVVHLSLDDEGVRTSVGMVTETKRNIESRTTRRRRQRLT